MPRVAGIWLLALALTLGCKDPNPNGGLPPEATGPFLPRLTAGWTLDSVTYTADLPMTIGDTTVPVRVHNKARDVTYWYKPDLREIWFYDYPDTLIFHVDWDAETLQLWHSELQVIEPGLGITFPLRLDFRLVP